ncbi:PTS sugar transporter subunit IIA [Caldisalinibacter kiritimatiensis]|uniref:PTS system, glucose-specific component IIC / IIB / IIA n=1 Tax=Caldisalinibacter kiritimatiensis TaxID=1304284 RepID=R1CR53_9FIRM|nr:PTS glucose transporter subunit IIA [Caldisalinibacter kiritimatiensis]EOD01156.1 PTS system, glucose-specific component IIC / IIB / IIA [Caldisalinibacter kiritimatiensis]
MFLKFKKEEDICSPINGTVKPITEAPDPAFSQKMMGDGFCVEPEDGVVVSPVKGTVATVFPTKHAVGITTKKGLELIIHFGMETVSLNGEGFTALVEAGDKVDVGDELLKVDIEKIKDKVPSLVTPVVVSNAEGKTFDLVKEGKVNRGEVVLKVK